MTHYKPDIYIKDIFDKPFGLSHVPTLEPKISDNCDCFRCYVPYHSNGSDNSPEVLDIVSEFVKKSPKNILEIGVSLYNKDYTITNRLINGKSEDSKYLGVDINDRSFVTSWGQNSFFLQESSFSFEKIESKLKELEIESLGLIVIDGDHSVNGILKDWKYVHFLHNDGFVLIHDTNTHPGPVALLSAIDRKIFNVEEPLKDKYDHGIGIISFK